MITEAISNQIKDYINFCPYALKCLIIREKMPTLLNNTIDKIGDPSTQLMKGCFERFHRLLEPVCYSIKSIVKPFTGQLQISKILGPILETNVTLSGASSAEFTHHVWMKSAKKVCERLTVKGFSEVIENCEYIGGPKHLVKLPVLSNVCRWGLDPSNGTGIDATLILASITGFIAWNRFQASGKMNKVCGIAASLATAYFLYMGAPGKLIDSAVINIFDLNKPGWFPPATPASWGNRC